MAEVRLAASDAEIERCFPVLRTLRTHLASAAELVERVRRQEPQGYRLAYVERDGEVVAVAGFREADALFAGHYVYVDDLVASPEHRSEGHGGRLLEWIVEHARARGCACVHLDSGVQRFAAHRFYLRHGMEIRSHHFVRDL